MRDHHCSEYGCDRPDLHVHGGPQFGGLFDDVGSFVSSAASSVASAAVSVGNTTANLISNGAKVAGREIDKAASTLQDAGGAVSSLVSKIPVVGAPLQTAFDATWHAATAPANALVDIAIRGKRIDQTLMNQFNTVLKDVKAEAPYAQMVVSMVPGLGSGVSAAIGGGMALMNGQPIDKALVDAVISAAPGGPLGKSLAGGSFNLIESVATGQKIDVSTVMNSSLNGVIEGLNIPVANKPLLKLVMASAAQVAHGQTPPITPDAMEATFNTVTKGLPADAIKALQTGIAMGTASVKQAQMVPQLTAAQNKLVEAGIQLANTNPAVGAARKLAGAGTRGFDLAQGALLAHAPTAAIALYRNMFKGADLQGYDMGIALKVGLVSTPPSTSLPPAARAGQAITLGMQGAPSNNKAAIMTAVTTNPSATVGAKVAVAQVVANRENFFVRILHALGFGLGHNHPPAAHA